MIKKITILSFPIFFLASSCNTQISSILKKTYGFEREVSGGMKETKDNSNIEKNDIRYQFFIFQEYSGKKSIEINHIWIKKLQYEFKIETISTPFLIKEKEIIPSSKNTVVKIMILDKKDKLEISSSLQKIINENELVIEGSIGKNKFLRAVQKLSKLEPLFTE